MVFSWWLAWFRNQSEGTGWRIGDRAKKTLKLADL
jgi:hypothetical protein